MDKRHVITYPGFAEGLSAKGLYDEIETAYSSRYRFHKLAFYEEDPYTGNRTVRSIDEHVVALQDYMDSLDGEIIILGKCGGSRVVSSLDDAHLERVERIALFNPPWKASRSGLEERFRGWRGDRRLDGNWYIPRNDSGTLNYIVTPGYIKDASAVQPMDDYKRLAEKTQLFIVRGMADEVIKPIDVSRITGAIAIDIEDGDHHLTAPVRARVISALAEYAILR